MTDAKNQLSKMKWLNLAMHVENIMKVFINDSNKCIHLIPIDIQYTHSYKYITVIIIN